MKQIVLVFALAAHLHAADVTLEQGLGNHHREVTTNSAEAQRYFDQGMRYIFAFNHEQAVASFLKATQLDPAFASAYWGAALALGPNINLDVDPEREKQAYDLVQTALLHAPIASRIERDLIDALALRYSNDPAADLRKLSVDYSAAMKALAAKYPDDDDVAVLYAESLMNLRPWKFWSRDGKTPAEGTGEIVSVLEGVLKRSPNHVGANHYYIHAVEASTNPARALPSADRLRTLAPSAGHLVHMPAHIYHRTGNYAGAAQANVVGAAADRAFIAKYGAENVYAGMYYNHNLDFGGMAYAMLGEYEKARELTDELSANAAQIAKVMAMVEGLTTSSLTLRLRFGRWTDVLRTNAETPGPLSTTLRHYARGVAFAQLGNVAGAESEQQAFDAARANLSADDKGVFQNPVTAIATVAAEILTGRIAMARGDRSAAIAAYRRAVAAEDQLDYNEPADWYYPTRETLGAALVRDRQFAEAESVFREDLARNPKNPRSLWGLSRALRAQGKSATKVEAEFGRVCKGGKIKVEDL